MTENGIGDEGAKALSEMLTVNTTLKSLELHSGEELNKRVGSEKIKQIHDR